MCIYNTVQAFKEVFLIIFAILTQIGLALRYPKEARKQKVQGSVTVEFTVLKDGKLLIPKSLNLQT
ncbi:MAG: TonB family protein [Parafilimonas sp.]|nr:TonB family protein [Parafilimonas sp.]